jgi:hypothetical protein
MHGTFLNFDQNPRRMESPAKFDRFIKLPHLYERNNGSEKGDNKARLCWCESKMTSEKNHNFFHGEVFFSLDRPFNG